MPHEMTLEDIDNERMLQHERREKARVERDLLIHEIQEDQDMTPADKDHYRDAINATYAAANGSIDRIADLATSNVLWARIHVRGFATEVRVDKALGELKTMLAAHIAATPDVSNMPWKVVLKNIAIKCPLAFALTFTPIVVFLIAYGFGDQIIKAFGI